MSMVDIPITDPKKPPQLNIADSCVHRGKAAARTFPVKLHTGAQWKSGQMVQLGFDVPMCTACAAKEKEIGNITWIPSFIAGMLACIFVFIRVWLLSPEGTSAQTYAFPYVLGAFIGMIAGILAGTLVEFILKMLFAPAYGKLL